jgi:hypothetical protein
MSFATELTRAVAQRGRLDAVYRDLSDHWTVILQRLFPVWALIGPGLAEPGHIELRSRTVYLDSDELLGARDSILAGTLERRVILRTSGVAIHEVFHAKHTMPLHSPRHTAAAAWLISGHPLFFVQRQLGHRTITTRTIAQAARARVATRHIAAPGVRHLRLTTPRSAGFNGCRAPGARLGCGHGHRSHHSRRRAPTATHQRLAARHTGRHRRVR